MGVQGGAWVHDASVLRAVMRCDARDDVCMVQVRLAGAGGSGAILCILSACI